MANPTVRKRVGKQLMEDRPLKVHKEEPYVAVYFLAIIALLTCTLHQ